jgi:hypothetical protein
MEMRGVNPTLKLAGVVSVALVGLLHLVEAPEYYGEVKYIGALFVLCAIGAAVAVYGMQKDLRAGWLLGAGLAGGNFIAYILSRTVGLPQFRENSWSQFLEPMGLISLAVEAIAFVICLRALRADSEGQTVLA